MCVCIYVCALEAAKKCMNNDYDVTVVLQKESMNE